MAFFESLKNHSDAKIEILNQYYIPWLRKVNLGAHNANKCLVIDGFAGQGIYEDGAEGSPLKLINGAIDFCNQAQKNSWNSPEITIILIEKDKKVFKKLLENIGKVYFCEMIDLSEGKMVQINLQDYPSINILIYNEEFADVIRNILELYTDKRIPIFSFVDPFGFSHTSLNLFKDFLENDKTEILFNFMYEEINRFITSDHSNKLKDTYLNLFGANSLDKLKDGIKKTRTANERKELIIGYYCEQLLEKTNTEYILKFEFKRKQNRTKMFLVYATKNLKGLETMKKAMWKVDPTGTFLYSEKNIDDAMQLKFLLEGESLSEDEHLNLLASQIFDEFAGKTNITLSNIEYFVLTQTNYPLGGYYKKSLKLLEIKEKIRCTRIPKARKYTYNEKLKHIDFT